jgi:non-specific serine/threonine protein kinase
MHLPLALDWRLRGSSADVEDLLRRLTDDVLRSTIGSRDLPERQQTMNATVAWSYQLLSQDERRAFRRFGALPGRFSIDAAAMVLAGRDASARSDHALSAVADLIEQEPSSTIRDLSGGSSDVQDARNREGIRGTAAH